MAENDTSEVKDGGKVDTSGMVGMPDRSFAHEQHHLVWSDLTPFQQGFVEAALLSTRANAAFYDGKEESGLGRGFSDLAPETLARIMEDCARFAEAIGKPRPPLHNYGIGTKFWESRQLGFTSFWSLHQAKFQRDFPSLRLYLADDGKVRIVEEVSLVRRPPARRG